MMKTEVVDRRGWLSEAEFLDLLGATHLLPGPNSTEMAIHIGLLRAGWRGLVVAGVCFIAPAALMVGGLAALYVQVGTLPQAQGLLYAVKPVMIVVVVQAIVGLIRPALKSRPLALLALLGLTLALMGVDELLILFGSGALAGLAAWPLSPDRPGFKAFWLLLGMLLVPLLLVQLEGLFLDPQKFSQSALFLFFLKVGSVLYGSGYVLLAFLRGTLVEHWHWLTPTQLLDAVAVGQLTPGPVFTTATFIGYLLGGPMGATLATVGIFLPSFGFVALSSRVLPQLRRWPLTGAVLDAVNAAALALMIAVTAQLGRAALVDGLTTAIAGVSAILLLRFRLNSAWVILAAAGIGLFLAS
jgi:chromate transporter